MANKPMLADYVALIIQRFERLMQHPIEQQSVKRGKPCLQKSVVLADASPGGIAMEFSQL